MARQRMNVQAPVARLFAERWSPRAFDAQRVVTPEQVATCLEAARWAPSCYGDQPWRFVVADRFRDEAAWQAVLQTLAPANRTWAGQAPVLVVAAALPCFRHNGEENRWRSYDTGQAMLSFCLQATALGLATHQMGGFDGDAVRAALNMPAEVEVLSVTALGYMGDAASLDEALREIERAPRTRLPLEEIAFESRWGESSAPLLHLGWQARYEESPAEELPWFHDRLDEDFAEALDRLDLHGGKALDLGCGPGTQAIALARMGFAVTACDVAQAAIDGAAARAAEAGVTIDFWVGDATGMRFDPEFDLVVDRGVLHCFADPAQRDRYIAGIRSALKPGGVLLLKCFSHKEQRENGPPCRYAPEDLRRFFADGFRVARIGEAEFQGNHDEAPPKALFAVIHRVE